MIKKITSFLIILVFLYSCNNTEKDIRNDFDKANMFVEHSTEFSDLALIFSMMTGSMSIDSIEDLIRNEFHYKNKEFIIVHQSKSGFHFIISNNSDSLLYELRDSTINIYSLVSSNKLRNIQ